MSTVDVEARLDDHETRIKKLEDSGTNPNPNPNPEPNPPPVQGHPKPPEGSENPLIVHVGANAYEQPNVPENVLVYNQADKEKRFTAKGIGSWLDINFDKVYDITGVDISFYKGTERKQKIDIIDDENVKAASIESDGQTEYQRFAFETPIKTNRIKLVNQGNAQNDYLSIRAVSPFGKKSSSQPEPEPQCPSGTHYDEAQKKCIPDTVQSGNLDLEGLPMIYPTKKDGAEYKASDFSYKRSTHNQSNEKNIPRDTFSLPNVKAVNVECTFVGQIDGTKDDDMSWKVGSKTHNDENAEEGQCYSVGIGFSGEVHVSKETPKHPDTPNFDEEAKLAPGVTEQTVGDIRKKNILIKVIRTNVGSNVRLECWYAKDPVDVNGKLKTDIQLKPYFTAVDDGSWKNAPQLKNSGKDGSQTVYMRIDHVNEKTKVYACSVREIDENPQPVNRMFAKDTTGAMTVLAFPSEVKKTKDISRETGNTGLLRLIRDRPEQINESDDDTEGSEPVTKEGDQPKEGEGKGEKEGEAGSGVKKHRRRRKKANGSEDLSEEGPEKEQQVQEEEKGQEGEIKDESTEIITDTEPPLEDEDIKTEEEPQQEKEVLTDIQQEDVGKELSLLDEDKGNKKNNKKNR